jgi:DNA-binding NarL/FixJ family response regulator
MPRKGSVGPAKPARELKWGKRALKAWEGRRPPDATGRSVLRMLREGLTTRGIGEALRRSNEMVTFFLRRLVRRRASMGLRASGAACLRRNCPTAKQLETLELMLRGVTEGDAARRLGCTQGAVSYRLGGALRTLKKASWAKELRAAIRDMRARNTILRFQSKPGSGRHRS